MKLSRFTQVAPFLIAGILGLVGCAGTPTKESTGEYVDDASITAKVKTALLKDDAVKSFQVTVETFKGVVQLSGFVDNADQKAAAAKDASMVAGVSDVKNNITIK
jgi:osmotically-inducible protein OsmY